MENRIKLSVIIPVYNVEEYLDKCLYSIVNQTFKNIEIIIVNDGSSDNSIRIIRKYESEDSRIKVIEKENEGVVIARKSGLMIATGDYIHYMDGDDYIELNCYQLLMDKIVAEDADIVFFKMFKSKCIDSPCDGPEGILSGIDFLRFSYQHKVYFSVWCHIHKRELYNNPIRYHDDLVIGEDVVLNQQLAYHSKRIAFVNVKLYHYVYRPSSLTGTKITDKRANDNLQHVHILLDFCRGKRECEALERSLFILYLDNIDFLYSQRYFKNAHQIAKEARAMVKKYPGIEKESFLKRKYKLTRLYAVSSLLGALFARYYIAKGKIK